jgi:hypothetical protein
MDKQLTNQTWPKFVTADSLTVAVPCSPPTALNRARTQAEPDMVTYMHSRREGLWLQLFGKVI